MHTGTGSPKKKANAQCRGLFRGFALSILSPGMAELILLISQFTREIFSRAHATHEQNLRDSGCHVELQRQYQDVGWFVVCCENNKL